ncbi:MAG: cobalamin-dependent protein, partial [Bacteroidales bacterium]|nr:cobalamin-dependent protein [Bacteroidales bacterium]
NSTTLIFYYKKTNRYSYNALIAALENFDLRDIDIFIPSTEKELLNILKALEHDYSKIVLIISFFTTQIFEIINLIKRIKTLRFSNLKLLAGGPHPTGEPYKSLKMGFDYILTGEGEITFSETIKKILKDEISSSIINGEKVKKR